MSSKKKAVIAAFISVVAIVIVFSVSYYLFAYCLFNEGYRIQDIVEGSSEIWVCRNEDFTFTIYNQNNIPDEYRAYLFDMGDTFEELSETLPINGESDCFGILDMKNSSCKFAVCWEPGRAAEIVLYNCKILEEAADNEKTGTESDDIISKYTSYFNVGLSSAKDEFWLFLDEEFSNDPDIKSLNVSELVLKREESKNTD